MVRASPTLTSAGSPGTGSISESAGGSERGVRERGRCRADQSPLAPARRRALDVLEDLKRGQPVEVVRGDRLAPPGLPPQVPERYGHVRQRDLSFGGRGGVGEYEQCRLPVETGLVVMSLPARMLQSASREARAAEPSLVSLSVPLYLRSSPSCCRSSRKCRTGAVSISRLAFPIQPSIIGTTGRRPRRPPVSCSQRR